MQEISPGIKQLKIPIPHNPLGFTNVYLVGDGDGYLLIDAGFPSPEAFAAMQNELAEAGVEPRGISRLVITHAHGDHIGLAGRVKEISGAKMAIHPLEARQQALPPNNPEDFARMNAEWSKATGMPNESMREMHHHQGRPGNRPFAPPPLPDILLEDNQEISADGTSLRVVWTPGHSPGLICLYDAKRKALFSADHVLPVTTPNIGLRPGSNGHGQAESNPLGDYLRSLAKVRDLDAEIVLPAHEGVFHDLRGRVDRILEHHRRRNDEIVASLKSGPRTAYQVSESITWMPESGGVRFHNLAHWDQRMAVSETIAHLQALRATGTITRSAKGGIVYYRAE